MDQILSDDDKPLDVAQVEAFIHPKFQDQVWHDHDIGIIKTSVNKNFRGDFKLESTTLDRIGSAVLFGCGRVDLLQNIRARSIGENSYFRFGAVLFFFGPSKTQNAEMGLRASIASNDSGAPVTDKVTGKVIGVAATSTASQSARWRLPVMSTTSTVIPANLDFINQHVESSKK